MPDRVPRSAPAAAPDTARALVDDIVPDRRPGRADTRLHDLLLPLVEPVVAAQGLDLEGLEVAAAGRRSVVRLLVDKDGGITLDDVADVSRSVSEALDAAEDVLPDSYVLEVGSPGVDRPLTAPRHWRRNAGRLVQVTPVDGTPVTGRVVSAADAPEGAALLDVDGTQVQVRYADVRRALVQVEFGSSREPAQDDEPEEAP